MRILVDTNIFLDFLLPDPKFQNSARLFFEYCHDSKSQIYVIAMTIRDIGYIAHRRLHDKSKSVSLQRAVYSICSKIVPISADAAISAFYDGRPDYEDSLIMEAAEESMCDFIVTRNAPDFVDGIVPAYDVDDFLKLVNSK